MSGVLPTFDRDAALARHGDEAVLRLLAPLAIKTIHRTRQQLLSADASHTQRAEALHKMRGNALEMSLLALAESTRPLELVLRGLDANGDTAALQAACLARLDEAEQALQPYLPAASR